MDMELDMKIDQESPHQIPGGIVTFNIHPPQQDIITTPIAQTIPIPLPPPTTFPYASPPTAIPLRPLPQSPTFSLLDTAYTQTPHRILAPQNSRAGYDASEDEAVSKEAYEVLEKHVRDRAPYTRFASDRLQAVMGMRNKNVFDLPSGSVRSPLFGIFPGEFGGASGSGSGAGGGAFGAGLGLNLNLNMGGNSNDAANSSKKRKDSGVHFGMGVPSKTTMGMHVVDKETGHGLREFLLQKGKEMGMRKRECKAISFHDFTPDIRTNRHSNVLLAHYEVEKPADRCVVYEVDLPTLTVDPNTNQDSQINEPWIWILISRPTISFDTADTSTSVPQKIESPDLDTPSTTWYTPPSQPVQEDSPTPPPNFPTPIPTSWLVFAAPLAHITAYPTQTEFTTPITTASQYRTGYGLPSHMVTKRRDFDFAHHGLPIFEFSGSSTGSLFTSSSPALDFLSVEKIGSFHANDEWESMTDEEYQIARGRFDHACQIQSEKEKSTEKNAICGEKTRLDDYDSDDEAVDCNGGVGVQSPNQGAWWKEFYRKMYADRKTWRGVKHAMGRGKCRVVVRWLESETAKDINEIGDGGGALDDDGNVDMEKLEAKRVAFGKRVTRSQARRRSALTTGVEGMQGLALGESLKARAAGNAKLGLGVGYVPTRGLGLGLGREKERERDKARVKKR